MQALRTWWPSSTSLEHMCRSSCTGVVRLLFCISGGSAQGQASNCAVSELLLPHRNMIGLQFFIKLDQQVWHAGGVMRKT